MLVPAASNVHHPTPKSKYGRYRHWNPSRVRVQRHPSMIQHHAIRRLLFQLRIHIIAAILKTTLKPRPSRLPFGEIIQRVVSPLRVYLARMTV
ncbi:hypothetical protein BDW72DRAFT_177905 [Aspergillus terricola var. indicus]